MVQGVHPRAVDDGKRRCITNTRKQRKGCVLSTWYASHRGTFTGLTGTKWQYIFLPMKTGHSTRELTAMDSGD